MRFDLSILLATALGLSLAQGAAAQTVTPPPIPAEEEVVEEATEDAAQDAVTPPPPPPAEEEEAATPPPPPEPEPEPEFFTSTDGSTEGPFPLSELQAQATAGAFTDQTYVWQDGMADWTRAGEVEELASLFGAGGDEAKPADNGDLAAFVVGVWSDRNTSFVAGMGETRMDLVIEYYSNGTMDAIGQMYGTVNGQAAAWDIYAQGTWSVAPAENGQFDLTTNIEVSMGLVESPVYTDFFQSEETTRMERVDANSMRDVQNELTYSRY